MSARLLFAAAALALAAGCGPQPLTPDAGEEDGGGAADAGATDAGTQDAGQLTVTLDYELPSTCSEIPLSAREDTEGRPYLYVAAMGGGLRVYATGASAAAKATVPISQLGGLNAMNLSQTGTRLYLALGNSFGTALQSPGLAIVDVANPLQPVVRSVWSDGAATGGAGHAVSDGRRVYLAAMRTGVIVFDATDPSAPLERARLKPDLAWPDANNDPAKVNARGLWLNGTHLYLAYDAGGLRVLDVSNDAAPVEVGRYANPALAGKPRAYNNAVLDGTTLWVSVDYCGVEAIDVRNPAQPALVSWWNPWTCETNGLNWFSSNGHANEVALDPARKVLFVSSGKSDLQVLDVAEPSSPRHLLEYGGVSNGVGTWGVSLQADRAYLTYTCAVIPFSSNWAGVRALRLRR